MKNFYTINEKIKNVNNESLILKRKRLLKIQQKKNYQIFKKNFENFKQKKFELISIKSP